MQGEYTAFVFGASGLVGGHLVKELMKDSACTRIYLIVRKPLAIVNMKVFEIALDKFTAFDFSAVETSKSIVFCCVGTTIKKAGSQDEFRKVDYELPVKAATWAVGNSIPCFTVVSSIGANARSSNFYLRTKGEMEDSIKALTPGKLVIVRPSLLLGTRSEFRLGEELAKFFSGVMKVLFFGPFKKYRAIDAAVVARAMLFITLSETAGGVYESHMLEAYGKQTA